jgi:hypothetical protein
MPCGKLIKKFTLDDLIDFFKVSLYKFRSALKRKFGIHFCGTPYLTPLNVKAPVIHMNNLTAT